MGAGRAMVATERVVTRVVEAPSSNAGPVPTHHQIMADLIVLDQLHSLQAVIRYHVVSDGLQETLYYLV